MDMAEEIKEIKQDVKDLTRAFESFRLNASLDIKEIQVKAKQQGTIFGFLAGVVGSVIVKLILGMIK